jgi:hypothetical protein
VIYDGTIRTPHDGTYIKPEITWEWVQPGAKRILAVSVEGYLVASWHSEDHPFWAMNPGLRDLILQHYQAANNGLNP